MDQLDGAYIDMIEAKEEYEERLLNKILQDLANFLKDKFIGYRLRETCFYFPNSQELTITKTEGMVMPCITFAEMSLGTTSDMFSVLININDYCRENGYVLQLI